MDFFKNKLEIMLKKQYLTENLNFLKKHFRGN